MDFTSAFISMQQGHKVTRSIWTGYWCIKDNEIIMVTKEGKAVNLREAPDMIYTISNILCSDWVVCDDNGTQLVHGESITDAVKKNEKIIREDCRYKNNEKKTTEDFIKDGWKPFIDNLKKENMINKKKDSDNHKNSNIHVVRIDSNGHCECDNDQIKDFFNSIGADDLFNMIYGH